MTAYDPEAGNNARRLFKDSSKVTILDDEYGVLEGADALIINTEWSVFRTPDFDQIKQKLKQPLIFDGRNLYNPDAMKNQGFTYKSIGRKTVK